MFVCVNVASSNVACYFSSDEKMHVDQCTKEVDKDMPRMLPGEYSEDQICAEDEGTHKLL